MITHLHEAHEYPLVTCVRPHEHSDSCSLILEQEFRYDEDAGLDFSLHQIPLPPVALVDHRKNDLKKRVQDAIRAWVKPTPDIAMPANNKQSTGRLKHRRNLSPSPSLATDDFETFTPNASAIVSHGRKKCMRIESPLSSPS